MRPTSVIFLIISVLVACLGIMLCLGAVSMAEERGEELFATVKQEDGSYLITKYFGLAEGEEPDPSSSKNDTKKMELIFENVDVTIKGGSDVNKIEFYNFTDGMFSYKASVGGALTVEDLNGVMKMISFGTSGINFKGFRNLLFYHEYNKLDRKVIVYITDESNVNNIKCSVKNGNITVEDMGRPCDFTLTAEEGDMKISGIYKTSSLSVEAKRGSVTITDSSLYELSVKSDSASVDVRKTDIVKTTEIAVKNADVRYDHEGLTFDGYDVDIKALDGKLTYNENVLLVPEIVFDGAPDEDPNKQPEDEDEDGDEKDEDKKEDETTSYLDDVYVPNSVKIVCEKGNVTVNNVEPKQNNVNTDVSGGENGGENGGEEN